MFKKWCIKASVWNLKIEKLSRWDWDKRLKFCNFWNFEIRVEGHNGRIRVEGHNGRLLAKLPPFFSISRTKYSLYKMLCHKVSNYFPPPPFLTKIEIYFLKLLPPKFNKLKQKKFWHFNTKGWHHPENLSIFWFYDFHFFVFIVLLSC